MAAAAFLANVCFRGADGYRFSYPCTVSDVTAAFYIFPSGENIMTLPSNHGNISLVDIQLSAAGTDTRTANIICNQKATGESVLNAANLGSNLARQFLTTPLTFAGGSTLRFTQVT